MRAQRTLALAMLSGFLLAVPAGADWRCQLVGRCLYESPAFWFRIEDATTGQPLDRIPGTPLADVHVLAEWVIGSTHGPSGPLMVLDTVSGPDGVVRFPAWGPIAGPPDGLRQEQDPIITLFKAGYKVKVMGNLSPPTVPAEGRETARRRWFGRNGEIVVMEPFRGTAEEWVEELCKAAWPGFTGRMSSEQVLQFRTPYLARMKRLLSKRNKLPRSQKVDDFYWSVEREVGLLERGHQ